MDEKLIILCQKLDIPAFTDDELKDLTRSLPNNLIMERFRQGESVIGYTAHLNDIKPIIEYVCRELDPDSVTQLVNDRQDEIEVELSKDLTWGTNRSYSKDILFKYDMPEIRQIIDKFVGLLFARNRFHYPNKLKTGRLIGWHYQFDTFCTQQYRLILYVHNASPDQTKGYIDHAMDTGIELVEINRFKKEQAKIDSYFQNIDYDVLTNLILEHREEIIESSISRQLTCVYRYEHNLEHVENAIVRKKLQSSFESRMNVTRSLQEESYRDLLDTNFPNLGRPLRFRSQCQSHGLSSRNMLLRVYITID